MLFFLIFDITAINSPNVPLLVIARDGKSVENITQKIVINQSVPKIYTTSRWLFYFLLCYTVLTRANQLETAVHDCRILLFLGLVSIMSLSC